MSAASAAIRSRSITIAPTWSLFAYCVLAVGGWRASSRLRKFGERKSLAGYGESPMALDAIAWAGRHVDAIFIVGVAIIGIRFVAECAQAVRAGRRRYRYLKS